MKVDDDDRVSRPQLRASSNSTRNKTPARKGKNKVFLLSDLKILYFILFLFLLVTLYGVYSIFALQNKIDDMNTIISYSSKKGNTLNSRLNTISKSIAKITKRNNAVKKKIANILYALNTKAKKRDLIEAKKESLVLENKISTINKSFKKTNIEITKIQTKANTQYEILRKVKKSTLRIGKNEVLMSNFKDSDMKFRMIINEKIYDLENQIKVNNKRMRAMNKKIFELKSSSKRRI
jgi:chaperonin cofactor prefoldin